MDKNNPMYNDPQMNWNFMGCNQPNMPDMDMMQNPMYNQSYQYDQMFMYYRYMTQMVDYKIKCKEYDKLYNEK